MIRFFISTLLLLTLISKNVHAQSNDIEFLIKRIKTGYAGYEDRTKGDHKKFDAFVSRVTKEEKTDTFRILGRIVAYFDNPHLQVYAVNDLIDAKIDSQQCKSMLTEISSLITNKKIIKDKNEGYWINDRKSTIVAILKEKKKPGSYKIYFIASKSSSLVPSGYRIGTVEKVSNDRYITDFLSARGGSRMLLRSLFRNDSTFVMGDIATWNKMSNKEAVLPESTISPRQVTTNGRLLDKDNYLLTLPYFTSPNIAVVDSILKADHNKIKQAKTLILDVRNNPGGTVKSYWPILPYIVTKPIVAIAGYKFCSTDLLEHRKEQLSATRSTPKVDSVVLTELIKDSIKISLNLGKFVFEPGDTLKFDSAMVYPKNVAIIQNFSVESAAEMMILDFKQSSKVKTFGENTMGAVDYLNSFQTQFPSKKYVMSLATFKRYIPPGQNPIDPTGIKPDVVIPDQQSDWIEFVRNYYEHR